MSGARLEAWERRHAILAARAETLRAVARDRELVLTVEERAALRSVAAKLRGAASRVFSTRKG